MMEGPHEVDILLAVYATGDRHADVVVPFVRLLAVYATGDYKA